MEFHRFNMPRVRLAMHQCADRGGQRRLHHQCPHRDQPALAAQTSWRSKCTSRRTRYRMWCWPGTASHGRPAANACPVARAHAGHPAPGRPGDPGMERWRLGLEWAEAIAGPWREVQPNMTNPYTRCCSTPPAVSGGSAEAGSLTRPQHERQNQRVLEMLSSPLNGERVG